MSALHCARPISKGTLWVMYEASWSKGIKEHTGPYLWREKTWQEYINSKHVLVSCLLLILEYYWTWIFRDYTYVNFVLFLLWYGIILPPSTEELCKHTIHFPVFPRFILGVTAQDETQKLTGFLFLNTSKNQVFWHGF